MSKVSIPVKAGDGQVIQLHCAKPGEPAKEKGLKVRRGALCLDWFDIAINASGHYDLAADGSPVVCGLTKARQDEGWALGPAPKADSKPKAK